MSSPCIEFKNVSKTYRVGNAASYGSLRDDLASLLSFRRGPVKTVEALKNISFTIEPGESVALVGRNGAGKSTTLKLLCDITQPTSGNVSVRGRIAPLMELGAGLHSELTGRENIAFFAAILGMSREETIDLVPSIIEFSELGDFIDVPVKKYSSGMKLRLGFATAIHSPSDILVIDEVLAVGDEFFVKKCTRMIENYLSEGKTLFFVSHYAQIVKQFTNRALLFDQGQLNMDGPTEDVLDSFSAS